MGFAELGRELEDLLRQKGEEGRLCGVSFNLLRPYQDGRTYSGRSEVAEDVSETV